MKSGETGFLQAKINNLEMDVVSSVIFTLKREDGLYIKKTYPEEVEFDGTYFLIPLDQRETNKLTGTYRIESQVNFVDKNVLKSNILVNFMDSSLGTEYLRERNASNQAGALEMTIAEAYIIRSGEGGTSDYNQLMNQPKINGITLKGNKSLADLGIDTEIAEYVEAHKEELKGDTGAQGAQGIQGIQGEKGATGAQGEAGYSPSAKVERVTNGAKITITDASGTTEAVAYDGNGGASGGLSTAMAQAIYNLLTDAVYASNNHSSDLAIIEGLVNNESPSEPEPDEPVEEVALTSISVTNSYSSFEVGQSFNVGGIVVTAHYSDGTSKQVDGWEASAVDTSTAGTKTCTITYSENGITKTTSINIEVTASATEPEPDEPTSAEYIYTVNSDKTITDNNGNVIHTLDNNYDYRGDLCLTSDGYKFTELTGTNNGYGCIFECASAVEITVIGGGSRKLYYINDEGSAKALTGVGTASSKSNYYSICRDNTTSGGVPYGMVFKTTSPIVIKTA